MKMNSIFIFPTQSYTRTGCVSEMDIHTEFIVHG